MRSRRPVRLLALALLCLPGLAACGAEPETPAPKAVTLRFAARVGAEPFSCVRTLAGLGTSHATVEPLDFRLYVHDVRLLRDDGARIPLTLEQDGVWQHENVALLDFEDRSGTCANGTAATNTTLRGTVPAGSYSGVSFRLGVPFALNHGDASAAPSPLNLSALFWGWNGGYKFLRLDARITAADGLTPGAAPPVFNLHLGSTDCAGDPASGGITGCARPNRPELVFDTFSPDTGTLVVDYAALVAGSDLALNGGGAPGCQSAADDPDCGPLFSRLGLNLATGAAEPSGQTFFRVE